MGSINRHLIHERIARVYDTATGAQAQHKGITQYVKELRKSVCLKNETAGGSDAFMRDFGRGI